MCIDIDIVINIKDIQGTKSPKSRNIPKFTIELDWNKWIFLIPHLPGEGC